MPKVLKDLDDWLQFQEHNHPLTMDLGLERVREVWQRLGGGAPAKKSILIAGTNGKGSCVRWFEALAQAAGQKVLAFSSPHLRRYNERIRMDGAAVDDAALLRAFTAIDAARGAITLTYFEWSTLAALVLAREAQPEWGIFEVGMGGRLDATNIIEPEASLITRIGLDHQQWLGTTRDAIALEKAGIMRPGKICALADEQPPAVLEDRARELGAQLWRLGRDYTVQLLGSEFRLTLAPDWDALLPCPQGLPGAHQCGHFAAVAALWRHFDTLPAALAPILRETKLEGRLSYRTGDAQRAAVLLDVAHNADSAEVLAQQLKGESRRIVALCSMLSDKDHEAVFRQLAPYVAEWLLFPLPSPRSTPVATLQKAAQAAGIPEARRHSFDSPEAAFAFARAHTHPDELLLATGSFVTVACVEERLDRE